MGSSEILGILKEVDALKEGHFKLSSGLHSDRYFQCARLFMHPSAAEKVVARLAEQYRDKAIDVVIGPAMGGIRVAYELARQLGAKSIFAERVDGRFTFRRGFTIEPGERVMVVEDVITTGKSINEVIELLGSNGIVPVATACVVDRSRGEFGGPDFQSAVKVDVATYVPENCPLCAAKRPIDSPGSRFIAG